MQHKQGIQLFACKSTGKETFCEKQKGFEMEHQPAILSLLGKMWMRFWWMWTSVWAVEKVVQQQAIKPT